MMIAYTPWGIPDSERAIADGITFYETPSHGGIHLSDERLREFKEMFPDFKPFCKQEGWFEEDCDWAYVALRFPEYFTVQQVRDAILTAAYEKSSNAKVYDRWCKTVYGEKFLDSQPTHPELISSHAKAITEEAQAVAAHDYERADDQDEVRA